MMKAGVFAAAAVISLWALATPSLAQPRPAGGDCEAMSEAYGAGKLWWGRFSGGRRAKHSFRDDRGVEYHTAEACFRDRQTCEAWLYRLKSDWQFMPRYDECLRGYRR